MIVLHEHLLSGIFLHDCDQILIGDAVCGNVGEKVGGYRFERLSDQVLLIFDLVRRDFLQRQHILLLFREDSVDGNLA